MSLVPYTGGGGGDGDGYGVVPHEIVMRYGSCRVPGCREHVTTGSVFCNYCVCAVTSCPEKKLDTDRSYCRYHECHSCHDLRVTGSVYCEEHKCWRCSDQRRDGFIYCNKHLCQNRDCTSPANSEDEYCFMHK